MWADVGRFVFFLPKMIFNALSEQISLDQYLKPHISKNQDFTKHTAKTEKF